MQQRRRVPCAARSHLRDKVLVLGRLEVLAVVHLAEIEHAVVLAEHGLAAREGVVRLARAVDLPWEQARRDRHDGVELAALELALPGRKGEHGGVAVGDVVVEGQARLDGLLRVGHSEAVLLALLGKPARVAARDVPG